jgi:hypothetical protein
MNPLQVTSSNRVTSYTPWTRTNQADLQCLMANVPTDTLEYSKLLYDLYSFLHHTVEPMGFENPDRIRALRKAVGDYMTTIKDPKADPPPHALSSEDVSSLRRVATGLLQLTPDSTRGDVEFLLKRVTSMRNIWLFIDENDPVFQRLDDRRDELIKLKDYYTKSWMGKAQRAIGL